MSILVEYVYIRSNTLSKKLNLKKFYNWIPVYFHILTIIIPREYDKASVTFFETYARKTSSSHPNWR